MELAPVEEVGVWRLRLRRQLLDRVPASAIRWTGGYLSLYLCYLASQTVPGGDRVVKYFAYGSNMDDQQLASRKVKPTMKLHAHLSGQRLAFNKQATDDSRQGFANIVPDVHGVVEGMLYEITSVELKRLDKCEGCPYHYLRSKVKVLLDSGHEEIAETYVANPNKVKDRLKPTKAYLQRLLAARDLLPESYVRALESWETLD